MSTPSLLTLHLGSALRYEAFETYAAPSFSGEAPARDELLWSFDPESLVVDDPEFGPTLRRPLPLANFSGFSDGGPCGKSCPGAGSAQCRPSAALAASGRAGNGRAEKRGAESRSLCLPAGDYLFCQWRKAAYASIEEGFEDFIRQAWWEGEKTEGPWMLRVVAEDGDIAYQGLRRLSAVAAG